MIKKTSPGKASMHTIYKFVQIVYIRSLSPAIRFNNVIDKAFPNKDQQEREEIPLKGSHVAYTFVLPGLK